MKRITINPRSDWQTQVESLGLSFHTINGEIYWDERACYQFDSKEVDELEDASNELEKMCLELVDQVVKQVRYDELHIPEFAWPLIESSWKRGDKNLYGRLDYSYDGTTPPKLLEYNADTPTALLEASVIQWQWLEQARPNSDQFNSIHERLVAAWPHFGPGFIHLTCVEKNEEDFVNLAYMADTIIQAGLIPKLLPIEQIGWDGQDFLDQENEVIRTLFKLYPWEWMLEDEFGVNLLQAKTQIIEPAWKMILSNKGLMVLLWEMFPDHPNLLPAYFDSKKLKGDYVKKPLLSREGENISLFSNKGNILSHGTYGDGVFMYQKAHHLPNFDGHYPVIGSWLVASESAGMGIREDSTPITRNTSRFVPHFFD